MEKINFSAAYKNNNNLLKTVRFYHYFRKLLTQKLIDDLRLVEINAPYIKKFTNNNERTINFDNLQTSQIFQIDDNCNQYFHKMIKNLNHYDEKINGVVALYTRFCRDCKITATNFITSKIIHCAIKINSNHSAYEYINVNKINEIAQIIIDTIDTSVSYEKIDKPNKEFLIRSAVAVNIKNFLNKWKTLKLEDYIEQEVFKNKSVLFTNTKQNYSPSLVLNDFSNIKNILEDGQWVVFNEQSNTIINVIEFMTIKDHDSNSEYFHIKINLDRLVMLILKKSHLAEVIPGIWDDNLEKEALNKKVEIF